MFPLHDRTRRLLCRTIFLIIGVLPTLAVVAWSASINSVAHLANVQSRLQDVLGLEVRLDRVSYPRPYVTLLHNLELVIPPAGASLLKARMVEVTDFPREQTIVFSQPEIDAASFPAWRELIEDRLQRPTANPSVLRFAAAELTLRWAEGAQTLADCGLQLETIEARRVLTAAFRLPESNSPEPLGLRFETSHDGGHRADAFEFQTGGTPLPCSLLAAILQCNNRLGSQSQFQGVIRATTTPSGWNSAVEGRIENIDLQAAISNQFPHPLSGAASIDIRSANVHNGRLEQCDATLRAGPGVVGQSLLAAAVESLRFRTIPASNPAAATIPYEELAADFRLDANGLVIRGQCGGDSGVVMRYSLGTLVSGSTAPVPVVALVKMLVPDSRLQVPATRQTDWLLRLLPVPDVLPRDPQSPPQARLRTDVEIRK